MTGGTPSGGAYAGPGVATGTFDAATAGIGTHTITYTFSDLNGCIGMDSQTITVGACASLNEEELNNIVLYPNPTAGEFTVKTEKIIQSAVLTDMNGRTVKQFNAASKTYSVQGVPQGLYFVQLTINNTIQTVRLIVK